MKLSTTDRLLLLNQYEILKQLTADTDTKKSYAKNIEILGSGYECSYDELDMRIDSHVLTKESSDLVHDILGIYFFIEAHKENAPQDDEISRHQYATFRGFDGNREGKLKAFANFLFNNGDYQQTSRHKKKMDNFNSHMEMIPAYERMIAKQKEFGIHPGNLSREQMLAILEAAKA